MDAGDVYDPELDGVAALADLEMIDRKGYCPEPWWKVSTPSAKSPDNGNLELMRKLQTETTSSRRR